MTEPIDALERDGVSASPSARSGRVAGRSRGGAARVETAPMRRMAPGADSEGKVLTVPRAIALTGQIARCDKLIVEGTVETDLAGCRELEVARTGVFRGSVDAGIVDIAGTVEGPVIARGMLVVRAGGVVRGDVAYEELEIERGATVAGEMRPLLREGEPAG